MAMVKKAKKFKTRITEWKQKQRKWSWTEAWVKIERMIIIAAPPPPQKKDCSNFRLWKCNYKFSYDKLFVTREWKICAWNVTFIYLHGKEQDPFRRWFHHGLYKSIGLHVPGNIPLTLTEFYIVSTALTNRNVPFGIWKRPTFHCPDQDIFLRTTISKFPLQCFWSTPQIYVRSPLPPPK